MTRITILLACIYCLGSCSPKSNSSYLPLDNLNATDELTVLLMILESEGSTEPLVYFETQPIPTWLSDQEALPKDMLKSTKLSRAYQRLLGGERVYALNKKLVGKKLSDIGDQELVIVVLSSKNPTDIIGMNRLYEPVLNEIGNKRVDDAIKSTSKQKRSTSKN